MTYVGTPPDGDKWVDWYKANSHKYEGVEEDDAQGTGSQDGSGDEEDGDNDQDEELTEDEEDRDAEIID